MSVSSTAPTLPGGYTKYRLISAVYNDSGGDIVDFYQKDNYISKLSAVIASGAATTLTAVDISSAVPDIDGLMVELVHSYRLASAPNTGTGRITTKINGSDERIMELAISLQTVGWQDTQATVPITAQEIKYITSTANAKVYLTVLAFYLPI